MSDEGDWQWENAGFGRPRKPLDVPMEVGPTFEEYAGKLEAAQQAEDAKERAETTARRKLMERVAVHAAQYQMLAGKNARMVAAAKDYQYYALPKLYVVRPVMTQAEIEGFIAKNQEILDIATALVAKNEKIAALEAKALVDYAED